ncbi:hypothetical protein LJ655_02330 [Paraburkholderia sp. MMS20-SJTN17]|uniref:Secretion system X translation initiation factor n=1 Tax=Paraburkholderia translucens TaxID=2886945 RepID=A0ABS8K7U6_9BURK|nr:hypothetical protein [Paraburkholderia sp. MMS20-SJTN17]MCC8400742.1 hypothetical protein [Paraburkholderia sp. MMS20-SJTN17]
MKSAFIRRTVLGLCLVATIALSVKQWHVSRWTSTALAAVNLNRPGSALPASAARDAAADHGSVERPKQPAQTASASAPRTPNPPDEANTASDKLAALRKPMSLESRNNPFAASSWLPPPPPVVQAPPEPPPPPIAPPLPYVYLGKMDGSALKPRVFLSSGDQLLIVSQGEVVDGQYRVESISDTDIVLTYLPLNQRQVISMRSEGK